MRVVLGSFGGIMPRLSEHKLAPTQATVAHDVNLRNGKLEAWHEPCAFGDAVSRAKSFHLHGCCLESWRDIVTAAELTPDWGRFYITGRECGGLEVAQIDACCNIEYFKAGVPAPTVPPVACAAEQCSREADVRSYVYTYVNQWGEESAPSPASNIVRVDDGSDVVVSIADTPPVVHGIVARNLYRASTGFRPADGKVQKPLTDYLFVLTVPLAEHVVQDAVRGVYLGAALETQYDRMPPKGLMGVTSIGDQVRLAGFRNNRVYFSEQFQPHNWPAKYDLTLDHSIVHMGCLDQRLFVTTDSIPYVIDVSSCDDTKCTPVTSLEAPLPDIGCHYAHGACVSHHGMFYASPIGIVLLQPNGTWHIITSRWFGQVEWRKLKPDTIRMAYWEGYLFFATDMATFLLNINGKPYDDMEGAELVTLSDAPIDLLPTDTGKLMFLQDDKVWVWDSAPELRPYVWRSRPLTSGQDASGNSSPESNNPARDAMWWPSSVKLGATAAQFRLWDSHERVIYERPIVREKPRRLPRCGRHLWYKAELRGVEPVEFLELGTSTFTVNQGA